jgi:hypothetical protein
MSAFDWREQSSEIAEKLKPRTNPGHGTVPLHISNFSKPVEQLSLDGEPIRRFPSLQSAANEMGCTRSAIQAVINGRSKQSMGFKWRCVADFRTPQGDAK